MRLHPVFLVARPHPPTMTTRRAMLMTCAGTFLGALVGGACGYAAGAGKREEKEPAADPADQTLTWLREMASERSSDDLLASKGIAFLTNAGNYPQDKTVQVGVTRLVGLVVADRAGSQRRILAKVLARYLETSPSEHLEAARSRSTELHQIAK